MGPPCKSQYLPGKIKAKGPASQRGMSTEPARPRQWSWSFVLTVASIMSVCAAHSPTLGSGTGGWAPLGPEAFSGLQAGGLSGKTGTDQLCGLSAQSTRWQGA